MDPYQQQNQNTPLKSNDFQAFNIQNPGQVVRRILLVSLYFKGSST